jgi:hypothetical protein
LKCHKSEVEIECLGDMEEVEELIDPGKDPSPPPHAGGKQKQKRIRKKPEQLRELAESGDRNYALCFMCDTPYSVKNKHNCHVNVKKRKANAGADGVVMPLRNSYVPLPARNVFYRQPSSRPTGHLFSRGCASSCLHSIAWNYSLYICFTHLWWMRSSRSRSIRFR